MASSGELPLSTYHRAQALGAGTFGSVLAVYSDEGEEFAIKLFLPEDDDKSDDESDDMVCDDSDADDDDDDDDDDEDPDEDSDNSTTQEEEEEESVVPASSIDVGALREISILRVLREQNAHRNIVPLHDVNCDFVENTEEDGGAGTSGCLGIVMPLYHCGTLGDVLDDRGRLLSRKDKVGIAHGLLSAVAHLHDNGIIHRDIKADNVMLLPNDTDVNDENGGNNNSNSNSSGSVGQWTPVLIDFSLAKPFTSAMFHTDGFVSTGLSFVDDCEDYQTDNETNAIDSPMVQEIGSTHTAEVGTATYTAPEVVAQEPYGLPSDVWSVGVVLLETLQGHTLQTDKNKEAATMVAQAKRDLPEQPFPNLVRELLTLDPDDRVTAREALHAELFVKFDIAAPTVRKIDLCAALPLESETLSVGSVNGNNHDKKNSSLTRGNENAHPNVAVSTGRKSINQTKNNNDNKKSGIAIGASDKKKSKDKSKDSMTNPTLERRKERIQRACDELDCENPLTPFAAMIYYDQFAQLDDDGSGDMDSWESSLACSPQSLLDCVVLAARYLELSPPNLDELNDEDDGNDSEFAEWSLEKYVENESTIFMMMDYCLLPRVPVP